MLLFILVALDYSGFQLFKTKLLDYAASCMLAVKPKPRVDIKNVGISFPKAVVLEGIYLEDTQTDTLIYARKAKVNMALYGLFSNTDQTSVHVTLEDAIIKLYTTHTDPLFNYHFLITAFSNNVQTGGRK
jgi:translocation and assembly module TamB